MAFHEAVIQLINGKSAIEDEWYLEKFVERFVSKMAPVEAFEAIDGTVALLLEQSDECSLVEVLQILLELARQSGTTQIPCNLLLQKSAIERRCSECGSYARSKALELLRYYRL